MLIGFACSWGVRVRVSVWELISWLARTRVNYGRWRDPRGPSIRATGRCAENDLYAKWKRKFSRLVDTAGDGRRREGTEEGGRDATSPEGRAGLWDVNCKCSGEPDNRIISQTVPSPLPVAPPFPIFRFSRDIDQLIRDELLKKSRLSAVSLGK